MQMPDLGQLSSAQKDELIGMLWPLQEQVQGLAAQVVVLQEHIRRLESRLTLNSKNSSKPPGSDGLSKPAPRSLRQSGQCPMGGQKGHEGNTLRQSVRVDRVIEHQSAPMCTVCQSQLNQHEVIDKRQVFELPALQVQVIEHHLIRSRCTCGAVHQGAWPEGVNAPAQYGARLKALAVQLNQYHLVPLGRTGLFMQDAFGVNLSQASVQAFGQEAARALTSTVAAIGQAVQGTPIVHADESGIRVQGKLHWLHCAVTPVLSWLGCHAKRGPQAFEALGILGGVRGTLVHDGLAGYRRFDCLHSLCNAHHLRELTFVHEQEKIWDPWAREMIELLLQANGEVAQVSGSNCWHAGRPSTRRTATRARPPGCGAGVRRARSSTSLKRLREHRADVWRFMTDKDVPFTNNLAEQALRMSKVKQKISGGFRTVHGADTFLTIRSYLATMQKQGACLFDCLASAFVGQPIQPRLSG